MAVFQRTVLTVYYVLKYLKYLIKYYVIQKGFYLKILFSMFLAKFIFVFTFKNTPSCSFKSFEIFEIFLATFEVHLENGFCLKTRHIFKNCIIYLKSERFCKSKFTLSKVKSESEF